MAKSLRDIKITWQWDRTKGDYYALRGFNVAITLPNKSPNDDAVIKTTTGKEKLEHTFRNIVVDTSKEYTAWVQAIYDSVDSSWASVGGFTIPDDDKATIATSYEMALMGNRIDDFSKDNMLTRAEANALKTSFHQVYKESRHLYELAGPDGLNLVTERNNYDDAINELKTYLETYIIDQGDVYPIEINLDPENGDRTAIKTKFEAVQETKSVLLDAITQKRQKLAEKNASDSLQDFIDSQYAPSISDLESQIDGSMTSWFYDEAPIFTSGVIQDQGDSYPNDSIKLEAYADNTDDFYVGATVLIKSGTELEQKTIVNYDGTLQIATLDSSISFSIDADSTYEIANKPANEWTTTELKNNHLSDMYYDNNTGYSYRFTHSETHGYKWTQIQDSDAIKALELAQKAQDTADNKRRVFVAQPIPPYDEGDLWAEGTSGDLWRCMRDRSESGSFDESDWEKASKYTDDSSLESFVTDTYNIKMDDLQGQIDGKVESFFQNTSPSTSWNLDEKPRHNGDMWYNEDTKELRRYSYDSDTGKGEWVLIEDKTANEAYQAAENAQSTADGKITVFIETPTPPYYIGDLWRMAGETDFKVCINDNPTDTATEEDLNNDWEWATDTKNYVQGYVQASIPKQNTAPKNPEDGDLWIDTLPSPNVLRRYESDTDEWVKVTPTTASDVGAEQSMFKGATEPEDTQERALQDGDLWIDTSRNTDPDNGPIKTTDILMKYNGNTNSWEKTSVTDTSEINDGAGLGNTANWKDVKGKPPALRQTFYGSNPPGDALEGDFWIDTSLDDNEKPKNVMKRYEDDSWVLVQDQNIQDAIEKANEAQVLADGKINTYYGSTPTGNIKEGDLWYDTTDDTDGNPKNVLKRYNGENWVLIRDKEVTKAVGLANDAQATADGKIQSFYQEEEPTSGMSLGDLWFDTNNDNKLYRYNGENWVEARDSGIGQAIEEAAIAHGLADSKIKTFFQSTEPASTDEYTLSNGDIWFDTDDNNKSYIYNSEIGDWEGASYDVADWSKINDDDGNKPADGADVTADIIPNYATDGEPSGSTDSIPQDVDVISNSNGTSDIKIYWHPYTQGTKQADMLILFWNKATIYKSDTEPDINQVSVGDVWIDIGNLNQKYVSDGDSWVAKNTAVPVPYISETVDGYEQSKMVTVNTKNSSYTILEGVAPNQMYTFGIAAGRRTENGVEITEINTNNYWTDIDSGDGSIDHSEVPATAGGGVIQLTKEGLIASNETRDTLKIDTDGNSWFAGTMHAGLIQSLNGNSKLDLDEDTFNFGDKLTWDGTDLTVKGRIIMAPNSSGISNFIDAGSLVTKDNIDWDLDITGDNKPEDGATVGAKLGVNVISNTGNLLEDNDLITSKGISADTSKVDGESATIVKTNAKKGKAAKESLDNVQTFMVFDSSGAYGIDENGELRAGLLSDGKFYAGGQNIYADETGMYINFDETDGGKLILNESGVVGLNSSGISQAGFTTNGTWFAGNGNVVADHDGLFINFDSATEGKVALTKEGVLGLDSSGNLQAGFGTNGKLIAGAKNDKYAFIADKDGISNSYGTFTIDNDGNVTIKGSLSIGSTIAGVDTGTDSLETTSGSQTKANSAQSKAESHADSVASSAETNAKNYADDNAKWVKDNSRTTANLSSSGWYRIASNSGDRAYATFKLRDTDGGKHNTVEFKLGCNYNKHSMADFQMISCTRYGTRTFSKARLLTNGTYDNMYVEVYIENADGTAVQCDITDNIQSSGWSSVNWSNGSIPSGYVSSEWDIDVNTVTIDGRGIVTMGNDGDYSILSDDSLKFYDSSGIKHNYAKRIAWGYAQNGDYIDLQNSGHRIVADEDLADKTESWSSPPKVLVAIKSLMSFNGEHNSLDQYYECFASGVTKEGFFVYGQSVVPGSPHPTEVNFSPSSYNTQQTWTSSYTSSGTTKLVVRLSLRDGINNVYKGGWERNQSWVRIEYRPYGGSWREYTTIEGGGQTYVGAGYEIFYSYDSHTVTIANLPSDKYQVRAICYKATALDQTYKFWHGDVDISSFNYYGDTVVADGEIMWIAIDGGA